MLADANEPGLKNLKSLQHLLANQQIKCDFQYHKMEFAVDIPVLVISEAKAMLATNCHVPLKPAEEQPVAAPSIDEELLARFRCYIASFRNLEFSIEDGVATKIEADFVKMRKQDNSIDVDRFHTMLTLAR